VSTRDAKISEMLALYALGLLEPSEEETINHQLAASAELRAELQEILSVAGGLAHAVPLVAPPERVGNRLMSSIGFGRFEKFVPRMATLFDVTLERARELLASIDQTRTWEVGASASVQFAHFDGGPACVGADCGFVRVEAGATFPWHGHDGEEVTLVLEGSSVDHSGKSLGPGDEMVLTGGQHDFTVTSDKTYLYAVRVYGPRFDVVKPGQE
jgi:hypothetical protein